MSSCTSDLPLTAPGYKCGDGDIPTELGSTREDLTRSRAVEEGVSEGFLQKVTEYRSFLCSVMTPVAEA